MDTKTSNIITNQLTDSQLITDEHQSELIGLANADRLICFRIGDIAIEEIWDKSTRGIAISHERIDEAIGRFVGKTGRTVRYYRETSAFYNHDIRNEYDMLPFSFFVFARSMGERWHEVLDFAKEHPQFKLEGIRIAFLGLRVAGGNQSVASNNPEVASGFESGSGVYESDIDTSEIGTYAVKPQEMREASRPIPSSASSHSSLEKVNKFATFVPEIMDIVSQSKLPTAAKVSLITSLKTLERLLPQLIKRMI